MVFATGSTEISQPVKSIDFGLSAAAHVVVEAKKPTIRAMKAD
jgi:hypothetical protein